MGFLDKIKDWRLRRAQKIIKNSEQNQLCAPSVPNSRYSSYIPQLSTTVTGSISSIASQYRDDFNFLGSPDDSLAAAAALYSAVTANATAIGALPPVVQRRAKPSDGSKTWVDIPDGKHPLYELLDKPMGKGRYASNLPNWTWQQMMETISIHCDIVGNAFLSIARYAGHVSSLVVLKKPNTMTADLDSLDYPYRYTYGDGMVNFSPSKIVNIMLPNPSSYWKGLSPLEVAVPDTVVVKVAKERQAYNLKNRVGANVIFKIGSALGASKEQFDEMRDHLSETYQESTDDGKPMVVSKAVEAMPLQTNEAAGKDILEARKVSAQEILSIYKVPGELIGNRDGAALQKFDKAILVWALNFIFPSAGRIYGAINQQAIWPTYGKGIRLWYSPVDSLAGLLMLGYKITQAKGLIDLGYPTNMAADRVDLSMPYHEALDVPNTKWVLAGRDQGEKDESKSDTSEKPGDSKDLEDSEDEKRDIEDGT